MAPETFQVNFVAMRMRYKVLTNEYQLRSKTKSLVSKHLNEVKKTALARLNNFYLCFVETNSQVENGPSVAHHFCFKNV